MKNIGYVLLLALLVLGCKETTKTTDQMSTSNLDKMDTFEKYRPRFHFTPKANWMNDPNGLVYHNEYYHLFYQYYPDSTVWGPMHWGHAKSKDLVQWEHLPVALFPDSLGYIFSGSAIIDKDNTAGFGKDAMIAIYTYHDPVKEKEGSELFQTQGIAFSTDEGETWTKYAGNPVIENPGIRDFRDPKVFWNEDRSIWQMVLVAKDHVQIYDSDNLKEWAKISEFRFADNPPLGVWECPDLFKLKVEGSEEEKWVMIISHGTGAPNSGSGTRYFVGDYDGTTFTTQQKESLWIDYGTDNYAGVTYNNTPDGKRIFIGWMSNWEYATTTPTETWRSAMTLPRELKLIKNDDNYLVQSIMIDGFETRYSTVSAEKVSGSYPSNFEYADLQYSAISFDVMIKDELKVVLSNSLDDKYTFGYKKDSGEFYIDRGQSGLVDFNANYKKSSFQTMNIGSWDKLSLNIILDASSVEIFVNDGEYVMTTQVFPQTDFTRFQIEQPAEVDVNNFNLNKINY